jgi:DNA gyrase inhibitor GyrI
MEVRLERLKTLRTICTHVLSDAPEEDARNRIMEWAEARGLLKRSVKPRLFGRNTYPTDNPAPHGYECYLTVDSFIEPEGDIKMAEIKGGLYAVLRFTQLERIRDAWQRLWDWIKKSEYEHVGWKKGKHGWVNGFEEHLNWYNQKPHNEWIFDLWVELIEEKHDSKND